MQKQRRGLFKGSPYHPVVTNPVLRWVIPGFALSYFGDGLGLLAIVLLARELTASPTMVGLAVALSSIPGAIGAVVFARWLAGRSGAQVAGWDATLRASVFALIALLAILGTLPIWGYIVLLVISSLLHSWGSAGRYTLLTETLDESDRMAGNAMLSTLQEMGTIVGPPVAGALIAVSSSAVVMAVDAATFAALALSYRYALRALRRQSAPEPPAEAVGPSGAAATQRRAGFSVIASDPRLVALLTMTLCFFLLFGPVYVALPLRITSEGGSPALLGAYYTAFGLGAFLGAVATGYLGKRPLWSTLTLVVLGFGVAMLPLGFGAPAAIALPAFAVGGAIWAPYMATSMAILQSSAPRAQLSSVLAANSALTVLAVPTGTALGGLAVEFLGARSTLLVCAVATIVLGLISTAALAGTRLRGRWPADQVNAET